VYGCALSLLLSSTVRMMFPPATDQLQGANVPADWLKRSSGSLGNAGTGARAVKGVAAIVAAVIAGVWMGNYIPLPKPQIFILLLVLLILLLARLITYQEWK